MKYRTRHQRVQTFTVQAAPKHLPCSFTRPCGDHPSTHAATAQERRDRQIQLCLQGLLGDAALSDHQDMAVSGLGTNGEGRRLSTEIATRIEQGARKRQEDAVTAAANEDGSWVIAVADGVGGVRRGDEAAPAAIGALPQRISGDADMAEAFAAANRAVRALAPPNSMYALDEDMPGYWAVEPVTTLAVAAWTPEQGMTAAWVGDSIVCVMPVAAHNGWYGEPVHMRGGNPVIGEFAVQGDAAAPSMLQRMRRMSDTISQEDIGRIAGRAGVIVAVLSDGAYSGTMRHTSGPWDAADRLGSALPDSSRQSADAVAQALMSNAWWHGLRDNAAIAVAVMTPPQSRAAVS